MTPLATYTATIYCGLQEGYDGPVLGAEALAQDCQQYVDRLGLGVSFQTTEFIYTHGREPGVIVGLINYPRFPSTPERLKDMALELAGRLMRLAKQQRVTVVCTDETITLERGPV